MKKRFALGFSPALVGQPLVGKLVREYDVDINILNADVASGKGGKLIVELSGAKHAIDGGVAWLSDSGIVVSEIVKELVFRQEGCVDCGSCTAVCTSGALTMDRKKWNLSYDPSLCIVCGLCVHACPLRLFSLSREREA